MTASPLRILAGVSSRAGSFEEGKLSRFMVLFQYAVSQYRDGGEVDNFKEYSLLKQYVVHLQILSIEEFDLSVS
jgi:hypothetical protein